MIVLSKLSLKLCLFWMLYWYSFVSFFLLLISGLLININYFITLLFHFLFIAFRNSVNFLWLSPLFRKWHHKIHHNNRIYWGFLYFLLSFLRFQKLLLCSISELSDKLVNLCIFFFFFYYYSDLYIKQKGANGNLLPLASEFKNVSLVYSILC